MISQTMNGMNGIVPMLYGFKYWQKREKNPKILQNEESGEKVRFS